jgi:hypothetical protein
MAEAIVKDASLVIDQKAFTEIIGSLNAIQKSIQSMGSVAEKSQETLEGIEEKTEETTEETEKSGGKLQDFVNWMTVTAQRREKREKTDSGILKGVGKTAKNIVKGLKRGILGTLLMGGITGILGLLLTWLSGVDLNQFREDVKKFVDEWFPGLVDFFETINKFAIQPLLDKIDSAWEGFTNHMYDIYDWFRAYVYAKIAFPIIGTFAKGGKGLLGLMFGGVARMGKIYDWFSDLFKSSKNIDDTLKNKKVGSLSITKRIGNIMTSFNNFLGRLTGGVMKKLDSLSVTKRIQNITRTLNNFVGNTTSAIIRKLDLTTSPKAIKDVVDLPNSPVNTAVKNYKKTVTQFTTNEIELRTKRLQDIMAKPGALRTAEEIVDLKDAQKAISAGQKGVMVADTAGEAAKTGGVLRQFTNFLNNNVFGDKGVFAKIFGTSSEISGLKSAADGAGAVEDAGGAAKFLKFGGGLIGGIGKLIGAFLPFKWLFGPVVGAILVIVDAISGALSPESFLGTTQEAGARYGVAMKRVSDGKGGYVMVPDPTAIQRGIGAVTGVIGGFLDMGELVGRLFGGEKGWSEQVKGRIARMFEIMAYYGSFPWDTIFGFEDEGLSISESISQSLDMMGNSIQLAFTKGIHSMLKMLADFSFTIDLPGLDPYKFNPFGALNETMFMKGMEQEIEVRETARSATLAAQDLVKELTIGKRVGTGEFSIAGREITRFEKSIVDSITKASGGLQDTQGFVEKLESLFLNRVISGVNAEEAGKEVKGILLEAFRDLDMTTQQRQQVMNQIAAANTNFSNNVSLNQDQQHYFGMQTVTNPRGDNPNFIQYDNYIQGGGR